MSRRRDTKTGDLFTHARGKEPVQRFDERLTAIPSLENRICIGMKEVADAAKKRGLKRDKIAERMSAYLGETVSEEMLDKYISQSSKGHPVPVHRYMAFIHATEDYGRLLNLLAEAFGYIMVPREYEGWIVAGQKALKLEQLEAEREATREEFRFAAKLAQHKVRP